MHPVAQRLHGALIRRPWLAPTTFAVVAGAALLWQLGTPDRIIFDETYYVDDARGYLAVPGVEPGFAVHPPLGKWFIAASILLLGDEPVGWRAAGALAGAVTVALTYLLAKRLLRGLPAGWWLALLAPVLLLADGLFVSQARIAMLDIFLVSCSTAALLVLLVDRDRRRLAEPPPWRPSLRVVAGVLLGAAVAVKWSGVLTIGAAGLLTIGWELAVWRRQRAGITALVRRGIAVVASLLLVPALVYGVSWVPWLVNFPQTHTAGCPDPIDSTAGTDETGMDGCTFTTADRLRGLVRHHDAMADFHLGLEATHVYRSDPLAWPVLRRPVVYYWSSCSVEEASAAPELDPDTGELTPTCDVPAGQAGEVLAVGNPGLWWGFLLLTPLLVAGVVTRDRRSALPLVGWLATWVPWLFVSRTAFLFYLAPAVPLLALGTVVALGRLGAPGRVRGTYLGAVVGAALGAVAGAAVGLTELVGAARGAALVGAIGWTLGAAIGAAADRLVPTPTDAPGRDTTGRWALVAAVTVVGLAVFFAPVWWGQPIDDDAIRDRWWFDTWV